MARHLASSGVNDPLLSVDAFHQETIPLEPVLHFAACAAEAGIPIRLSPSWLVSEEDENPYNLRTRDILQAFASLNLPIEGQIIFPSGNALKYLGEYLGNDVVPFNAYDEDPRDLRTISFDPNGDVLGGNVYKDSILDIIASYRP